MHDLSQILWICYVVCSKVNSSFERSNYTASCLFALIGGEPHTLLDLGSGGYCGILETPPKIAAKINRSKPQKKKNGKRNNDLKNSNKHDHFFLLEAAPLSPGIPIRRAGGKERSFYVSGKLPTYPSPKQTLVPTSHLGRNVSLGEG